MKNTIKVLGIIAIVTVIGFTMVACDNNQDAGGKDALDGTRWSATYESKNIVLTFNSPNFTMTVAEQTANGTYTISGSNVTLIVPEAMGGGSTRGTLSGNTLDFRGVGGPLFTKQ
jgi:hypothetical protein